MQLVDWDVVILLLWADMEPHPVYILLNQIV